MAQSAHFPSHLFPWLYPLVAYNYPHLPHLYVCTSVCACVCVCLSGVGWGEVSRAGHEMMRSKGECENLAGAVSNLSECQGCVGGPGMRGWFRSSCGLCSLLAGVG